MKEKPLEQAFRLNAEKMKTEEKATVSFIKQNTAFFVATEVAGRRFDKLPPALYTVSFDKMPGYFLELSSEAITLPKKLYGSVETRANRIISTYESRENSTGVLATGERGAGKTLLALVVASKMIARGIPVVQIQNGYTGGDFVEFINKLGNCMLIFDEYSKMYGSNKKEGEADSTVSTLEILDGVKKQKRLAMVMENEYFRIEEYLKNRPGRLFYHFSYSKIETEIISEYCKENMVPQDYTREIIELRDASSLFSFDILKAIVEEWKRYKLPLIEIRETLNFDAYDTGFCTLRIIKITKSDNDVPLKIAGTRVFTIKSIKNFYISVEIDDGSKKSTEDDSENFSEFDSSDVKVRDGNLLILDNGDCKLAARIEKRSAFVYSSFRNSILPGEGYNE